MEQDAQLVHIEKGPPEACPDGLCYYNNTVLHLAKKLLVLNEIAELELGSLAHFYLRKAASLSNEVQNIWCNMSMRWVPDLGVGDCQGVDIGSWEHAAALRTMRGSLVLANVAGKWMSFERPLLESGLTSHTKYEYSNSKACRRLA